MIFGPRPTAECAGAILAHALRLDGGPSFKKGARLTEADVARIAEAGHTELIVAVLGPGDLDEDRAAASIAAPLCAGGARAADARTGRVNVFAEHAGVLEVDAAAVAACNAVDESITLATLPAGSVVDAGQLIGTLKIIPFAVAGDLVAEATGAARNAIAVRGFRARRAALILTRLPHTRDALLDRSAAAQRTRVEAFGGGLIAERRCAHDEAAVAAALEQTIDAGADLVLLQGASAIVDRRDVIPAALERIGGDIVHFGMPVDPGNLLLLGRRGAVDVVGVPGCARSLKPSGFDMVLARLAAGLTVTPEVIAAMGVGGLLGEVHARPSPRRKPETSPTIAGVLLAAGSSRRMGPRNKLLAEVGGEPLVRRAATALVDAELEPIVVVTGHQPGAVAEALEGLPVELVHNPDHASGMASSVARGIAAVEGRCQAAIVALGDMPWIRPTHLSALRDAHAPEAGRLICVPTRRGKRGNPVLWSARFFADMRELRGDVGARALLAANPEVVTEVEVDDAAIHLDIDTADDLAAHDS